MSYEVSVLHDYFVDRIISVESIQKLLRRIRSVASSGGGSVRGVKQIEIKGGNATNLAFALGRFGVKTLLIAHSDELHEGLLRRCFIGLNVDLRIKFLPPGLTTSIEGIIGNRRVNVMLSETGGASDFSPSLLDDLDWKAIANSKIVCSVNWAANKYGNELLKEIRERTNGRCKIFVSTADVRGKLKEFRVMLRLIRREELIDWISMNENEARIAARVLKLEFNDLSELCRSLGNFLGIRVDVHTEFGSYTSDGNELFFHKTEHVIPRILTGAGDVWDAASIYCELRGIKGLERLTFADKAAKLFILSSNGEVPSIEQISAIG